MNLVEVLATAALGGAVVLAVAVGVASMRPIALWTRRALLLSALVVAAAAPFVAVGATAFGLGLRTNPAPEPVTVARPPLAVTPLPRGTGPVDASEWSTSLVESMDARHPVEVMTMRQSTAPIPWAAIAVFVWLAGAALGLLRVGASLLRLRGLRRSLTPSADPRTPGVFTSDVLRVPATVGVFSPVVVLPSGLPSDVDDAELAAILRHERAHVARRDPLAGLVARIARALHWMNPLVHVAARRLDAACESIADGEAVAGSGALPSQYAACLVRLAERAVASPVAVGVHGIVAGRGALTRRVEALLDPARTPDPRPSRRGRVGAIGLALLATIGLGCCCRGRRPLPPACCEQPPGTSPTPATLYDRVSTPIVDAKRFEELTSYAGRRNRVGDVHYYKELVFAGRHAVVRGFSPTAMSGTTFTDGMLTTAIDSAYPGRIVVYFEKGSRIDPDWLTGMDGSSNLQVLRMIPGTGNVPVPPLPNGVEVRDDRILFTPASLPLPNGQYSVVVFSKIPASKADETEPVIVITRTLHSFTVGSTDDVGPTVISTSPANRSTGKPPIVLTFSEEIESASVTPDTVSVALKDSSTVVAPAPGYPRVRDVARNGSDVISFGHRVEWLPATPLEPGRVYRCGVGAAIVGGKPESITDLSGNPPPEPYFFEFTASGAATVTVNPEERIRALEAEVAALRKQAADLQAGAARAAWKAPHVTTQPSVASAALQSQLWLAALHSMKDAATRTATLADVREGLDSDDPSTLLAALRTVRWMGDISYDRDGFHVPVLSHAKRPENDEVRRTARAALAHIQVDSADLPLLIEDAQTANRNDAESIAADLTALSGGAIEGPTADAVLHLLRDGTDIRKAFVMRGLQSAKTFAPRVEARLIEIVRSVDPHDYDSHYFFHFIASRAESKSDAIVDLILDTAATGRGQTETIVRGLRSGLSVPQRRRAAGRMLDLVENSGSPYARNALLEMLVRVAGAGDAARLEAIAANPNADARTKALATAAAAVARGRP